MELRLGLLLSSLLAMGACSTLRNEIVFQMEDLEIYQASARNLGFSMERADYLLALERWPWLRGAQLHRRALLLKTGLSLEALRKLDDSSDVTLELRYLEKIRPPSLFYKYKNQVGYL